MVKWNCLPYGLKTSSELFCKKLIEAIGNLPGKVCIADDIIVVGRGKTDAEVIRDHDGNSKKLRERYVSQNIKLNETKTVLRQRKLTFMGHQVLDKGILIDDEKIKASQNYLSQLMSQASNAYVAWHSIWLSFCQT